MFVHTDSDKLYFLREAHSCFAVNAAVPELWVTRFRNGTPSADILAPQCLHIWVAPDYPTQIKLQYRSCTGKITCSS